MSKELEQLEVRLKEYIEKSHQAAASTVSNFGDELKLRDAILINKIDEISNKFDEHLEETKDLRDIDVKTLKDIVISWKGVISIKSIVVGFGSLIVAIGVIGTGVIYVVKQIIK